MSLPSGVDEAVFAKVRTCIAEALALDEDDVLYGSRLIGDLGAESLDLLDITFRLERAFDVKIPRGQIEAAGKEGLAEGEQVITPAGLEKLASLMPEVPPEEFRPGLKVKEVPTLMRVATFYNIVTGLRAAKG